MKHVNVDTTDDKLFVLEQEPTKPLIFCLISKSLEEVDGVPQVDMVIESFVRMSLLSQELQNRIRNELEVVT